MVGGQGRPEGAHVSWASCVGAGGGLEQSPCAQQRWAGWPEEGLLLGRAARPPSPGSGAQVPGASRPGTARGTHTPTWTPVCPASLSRKSWKPAEPALGRWGPGAGWRQDTDVALQQQPAAPLGAGVEPHESRKWHKPTPTPWALGTEQVPTLGPPRTANGWGPARAALGRSRVLAGTKRGLVEARESPLRTEHGCWTRGGPSGWGRREVQAPPRDGAPAQLPADPPGRSCPQEGAWLWRWGGSPPRGLHSGHRDGV